ncbi:tautomerase family protein [Nonomuraea phyllanthi]|uniref:tautomerase family protein n=1 Tax=Nonomuraea phyllanthi TaxID=2219224 RepID=UPI0021D57D4E|nr:tautomerase family protein [Nonomuraea phyllanthi]
MHITAPESLDHQQLRGIADGVHRALVTAVGIPEGDRFQLITTQARDAFLFDPEYLGVARQDVVCIEITLVAGRTDEMKQALYRHIADNLAPVGVRREDVFVVLTENRPSDWSVGNGDAQLLAR